MSMTAPERDAVLQRNVGKYVGLATAVADADSGDYADLTEFAGTGYARVIIPATSTTDDGTTGTLTFELAFGDLEPASSSDVSHVFVCDDASGTAGSVRHVIDSADVTIQGGGVEDPLTVTITLTQT